MTFTCINGEYVSAATASIRVSDLSIQRGYGVFDFFRTVGGRPVFLADHLARLGRSMAALHLDPPGGIEAIRGQILGMIERNAIADSGLRVTVTGGYAEDGYTVASPNVIVTQSPLTIRHDAPPLRAITVEHRRQLPEFKTIDYLRAIQLRPTLRERGADEPIYHLDGLVAECPRANVFIVDKDGRLATPARHVLPGITRQRLLELDPTAQARDVTVDDLRDAREAFITGSTRPVVPIVSIDGKDVGDGTPGPMTRRMQALLRERIEAEIAK